MKNITIIIISLMLLSVLISNAREDDSIEWGGHVVYVEQIYDYAPIQVSASKQIGFRSDGIVVWRDSRSTEEPRNIIIK